MAETMGLQGQNKVLVGFVHLWGKVELRGFPVCYNGKFHLLADHREQIWWRI